MTRDSPPLQLTVALDFGTAYSGYAWNSKNLTVKTMSPETAMSNVRFKSDWAGAPGGKPYPKTRSAVIYSAATKEIKYWGHAAVAKAWHMQSDEMKKLIYIDRVKLLLDDVWLATQEGELVLKRLNKTTDEAIAELLQMLAESVKSEVRGSEDIDLDFHRAKWVLTVPAMWSDKAKSQMRKAMFLAELIATEDSDNLLLCLEPEAALISAAYTSADIQSGDNALVVDSGGGTVDLAAYSVDRVPGTTKMSFTELSQGTGGVYGSMILDGIFEVYLESVIGKEHWHLVRSNVAVWTRVLDQWNLVKTSFSGDMSMDAVEIELPRAAFTALGATRSDSVRGALRKHNGANIRDIRGDGEDSDDDDDEEEEEEVEHLLLTSVIIKKLFDQVVDGIIKLTMDVIADCAAKGADKAITKVLCVGGFSDNQYLVKRVRAAVQVAYPGIHVLVPALPSQAVLIGAVLYGVDPGTFKSRILRHTYGFGTLFQARDPHWNGVDTSALPKYEKPGMFGFATVYHKGFESMAKINDSVEADETKSTVVLPFSPEQEQVAVEIYMSSDREPKLITGTGCRHLGTISLPVDRSKGTDQQFEVQFKFGMTEIKTQFKNVATGEVQDVSLKYL